MEFHSRRVRHRLGLGVAGVMTAVTLTLATQSSPTAGEPAVLVPADTNGCTNFDGHVDHRGTWWSANGALLGVGDVPDSWWDGEPIPGRIDIGEGRAVFRADGVSVDLRRFSELHCAIG